MMIEPAVESQVQALMDRSFRVAIRASLAGLGTIRSPELLRELRALNAELVRLYARQGSNEIRLMRAQMTIKNLEDQDGNDCCHYQREPGADDDR